MPAARVAAADAPRPMRWIARSNQARVNRGDYMRRLPGENAAGRFEPPQPAESTRSSAVQHDARTVRTTFAEARDIVGGDFHVVPENGGCVASIKNIERDIRALEGFSVVIHAGTNRRNLPDYDYDRAARAPFTVADWKRRRIEPNYPDFDVEVLRADGRRATASTTLARIRADYE